MELDFVAEIGSSWYFPEESQARNRCLANIRAAADSGATIVKFQLFRAESLYSWDRMPANYERARKYELPLEWLSDIKHTCSGNGVKFWLSIFSEDLLMKVRQQNILDGIKIASGDLTNEALLMNAAKTSSLYKIPLAVSTGAATLDEIKTAISTARLFHPHEIILFHCKSIYPALPEDMNLLGGTMLQYRVSRLGLSDHTRDNYAAQIAVGMGYTIFEKHFGLPNPNYHPDDVVAVTPDVFDSYVHAIKFAASVVGEREKIIHPNEFDERVNARRGEDGLRPAVEE